MEHRKIALGVGAAPIRRILMPVDRKIDAAAASEYTRQVGFVMNAELCMLHVGNGSPRQTVHANGLPMEVRTGKPAKEIVRYAEEIDADLILMPGRRHGLIGQLLLGSTTMEVIANTKRAVWIASRQVLKNRPIGFSCRRIVCGIDVGKEAVPVLQYASDLAATWKADLIVVNAMPWSQNYRLLDMDVTEVPVDIALRRIMRRVVPGEVSSALELAPGDVAEVLREAVSKHRADLLVIGRGINTTAWQLGRNIGNIISRVPCSVVTLDGRDPGRRQDHRGMLILDAERLSRSELVLPV